MLADTTLPCLVLEAANYTDRVVLKCYGVIHSIESPLGKSWAEALGGRSYFQNPATKASVHYLTDADSIVQSVPEDKWTWSTGSPGSRRGKHIEQAGYAAFTRAQWLGLAEAVGTTYVRPNGQTVLYYAQDAWAAQAQFRLLALLVADISKRSGWTPRRGTKAELLDAINNDREVGVWFEHADITNWVGGTTHTDPGSSYPFDELMAAARAAMNPAGPSTPTAPTTPEEDMSYTDADRKRDEIVAAAATRSARDTAVLRAHITGSTLVGQRVWGRSVLVALAAIAKALKVRGIDVADGGK